MKQRVVSVMVAVSLYIGLVLALYALNRMGTPRPGELFPLWYSGAEILLKAVTAIGPGICAGWLGGSRGLAAGATAGGVGGTIEVIMLSALGGVPFGEFSGRIAVGAVCTAAASALTNAAGGIAGEFFRRQARRPASPAPAPEPAPVHKSGRRRRRRLRYG